MVIVGAGFRPVSDWVWLIMQLLCLDEVDISLVWGIYRAVAGAEAELSDFVMGIRF